MTFSLQHGPHFLKRLRRGPALQPCEHRVSVHVVRFVQLQQSGELSGRQLHDIRSGFRKDRLVSDESEPGLVCAGRVETNQRHHGECRSSARRTVVGGGRCDAVAPIAPRIGLAYAPGDRKTVVRVGFGRFYDRIPLRAVANALRGVGTDYVSISLQRTQVGAPVLPNKLAAFVPGTLFNLATIDPNIKNSYGLQASLQVEREITSGIGASLGFIHRRGVHIIMQRNLNVPTLTATQDPVNLGRPNPRFGNITQYSGQGDSYYDGMTLSLQNRSSRRLSGRVSYTLSKAIDNTGNAFFQFAPGQLQYSR